MTTYQYDALGNRVTSELTHDKNKEGQEDLSHWMTTIDRQQVLKAESTDILLSESLALAKENPDAFKKKKEGSASWRNKLTDQLSSRRGSSYVEKVNYVNDLNQSYPRVAQVTQEKRVGKKTTSQESQFIYGEDDQAIGTREESYHEDGLQSIASRVSLSDDSLETNELYDSFGSSELPMTNQLGYRGEWHDSQDSQNLRARNYDMSMGRFFQEDSEMGDLDEPGTQNKYAYVGNNPLGYSDESGNKRRGGFRGFVRKVFRPVVRYVRRYTPPRRPYRPAPRRYYPRPAPRRYYPRPVYRAPVRRYVPKRPVYRAPVRRYTPRKVYKAVKKVVRRASPKKVASYNKATKAKKASKGKKVQKKPSILAKAKKKINQAKKAVKKTVKSVKKTVKKAAKKVTQKTVSLAKKANEIRKKVVNKVCQTAKTVWNGTKKFYNENKEVIIKTTMVVAGIGMMAVPGLQGAGAGLLYGMTILDVTSAATGKDWLTQRKLSPGERVLNVVTAIPITKIAGKVTGFSLKGSNSVVKATTAGTKNATKNVANSVKPTPNPSPKPNIVSETEGFTITSGKGAQTSTTNSANRKLTDGAVAGDNIGNSLRTENGNSTVGRWMSNEEYNKMVETGKVQMSPNGNRTYVANPASPDAFPSASKGSIYSEFDVTNSALYQAGNENWAQIPGPGSLIDRLNQKKGLPAITEMPDALNIKNLGGK